MTKGEGTMRAVLFLGSKRPLEITDIPIPEIDENDVLIRVESCGLCHTDLHYIDHGVPPFKDPPLVLGHEASGTVIQHGRKVRSLRSGDPVLIPAVLSCGTCSFCAEGRSNICQNMQMPGNHIDGAFAQFIKVPAKDVLKLPSTIPLVEASVLADAVSTAYHAVVNRGRVRAGQWVVVFGNGGVGVNVVQIAANLKANVVAVDTDPQKLKLAKELGATETIQPEGDRELVKKLKSITGGGAHVAFECIGKSATIQQAHESIRRGGRLCIVGYCDQPTPLAVSKIMFYEQDVIGSLGCPVEEFPKVISLVASGKIKIQPLIGGKYPLSRIGEAIDQLRHGRGMRNLILPWMEN